MKTIVLSLVRFYKQCINPLLPNSCKYVPSCSAYMMQAVEKRGVFRGVPLGLYRILRCNPFSKGGFDPVKDTFSGKAKWLL